MRWGAEAGSAAAIDQKTDDASANGSNKYTGYTMRLHSKLSYAIAAILGGGASGNALSANSTDTQLGRERGGDQIQEIIVTAQRRSENIQNVPIAIQALTGETLGATECHEFR